MSAREPLPELAVEDTRSAALSPCGSVDDGK